MGVFLQVIQSFREARGRLARPLPAVGALALAGIALAVLSAAGQNPPSQPTPFPEKLLEGSLETFDLAILAQGDLRGSFGPCG